MQSFMEAFNAVKPKRDAKAIDKAMQEDQELRKKFEGRD